MRFRANAASVTAAAISADLSAKVQPRSASACILGVLEGKPRMWLKSLTGPGMPGAHRNLSFEKVEHGSPA